MTPAHYALRWKQSGCSGFKKAWWRIEVSLEAETLQIILSTQEFINHVQLLSQSSCQQKVPMSSSGQKADINRKNATPFKHCLRKIASIFIPLIPALVASGLIAQDYQLNYSNRLALRTTNCGYPDSHRIRSFHLSRHFSSLINASKEFGGTPTSEL